MGQSRMVRGRWILLGNATVVVTREQHTLLYLVKFVLSGCHKYRIRCYVLECLAYDWARLNPHLFDQKQVHEQMIYVCFVPSVPRHVPITANRLASPIVRSV